MKTSDIITYLFKMQDTAYRDFQAGLCPTLNKDKIIGVRTPVVRKLAKEIARNDDVRDFLRNLPHKYYEEDNLHAFIIESIKDFDECVKALDEFLPYVDNWATCDGLRPACFKTNKEKLLIKAFEWIGDKRVYVVRFGIGVLMNHFLDENFDVRFPRMVSDICSDEYYINMMRAWYFATALAKQYNDTIAYIENGILDKWTHNKTIQKAIESYRITSEQKQYLKIFKK